MGLKRDSGRVCLDRQHMARQGRGMAPAKAKRLGKQKERPNLVLREGWGRGGGQALGLLERSTCQVPYLLKTWSCPYLFKGVFVSHGLEILLFTVNSPHLSARPSRRASLIEAAKPGRAYRPRE